MSLIKNAYLGVLVCALVGIAAIALSQQYGMPVMILAVLLGLALHSLSNTENLSPGIEWSAGPLLYMGVALLGLKIDVSLIGESGTLLPVIAIGLLLATLLFGCLLGKVLKIDRSFSVLMASAVAVCGVSAAAAICCALPNSKERDSQLAITIGGITVLSTLALLFYPAIVHFFEFTETEGGIFLGGTIHNVSQAVGAGYAVSEQTGDITTIVKLLRVSALLPVIICITILYGRSENMSVGWKTYFPPFLIAFLILAVSQFYGLVPQSIASIGGKVSELFLIISLVAIGMKTDMKEIASIGAKPLFLLTITTIFMAGMAIAALFAVSVFNFA